ncbi:neurofascin isoform X2 [Syngnathoides biaculeatus]|uniref:neurofascin isoform X2 n=1 Tax=Syngnathoides biaculeatus TaxID=300417 RepID=UPI002ADE8253|nr:neurofascin isoform X2 [Syngnathoides biaculeatus]
MSFSGTLEEMLNHAEDEKEGGFWFPRQLGERKRKEQQFATSRVKMGTSLRPALLMLFWQSVWALDVPPEIRQPPSILKQSMKEHIVDPKDVMVIECEAKGNPHPIFSWRRNGKYFNVARDPQTTMRRRSGTLDIAAWNNPEQYEAEYQCIASNEYGSAYSHRIRLQLYRAPVWPREIVEPVVISAGSPLVLSCDPPAGPPKPETYWMSSCSYARPFNWPIQTAFPTMHAVRQDRRVSMGVNGDLYFSNVLLDDSASDFCCSARFPYKNAIQQKMPVVVKVLTTQAVVEAAPTWLSPTGSSSSVLVLLGEELLLECIAAGVPTPHISWTKDGEDLALTPRIQIKRFNKMLEIPKATFQDAGEYVCTATNKIGSVQHTLSVTVKAAPFWLEKPENLVLAPEESGRLLCRSDGAPRPAISWFVNGEPIEAATPQANRHVSGDTLTLSGVTATDTAVYQCNASNPFGYLLANAFVNVLHARARILGVKNELIKVVEGGRTFLDCRYFGSPVPDLRWSKHGQGNLEGNRFQTHSNGTLEIRRTNAEDQGIYVCAVSNVAGRDESQVRVEVKEPTLITKRPQDTKVIRGSDVRLECGVKADVTTPVTTDWLKDKKPLTLGRRISLDESNLVISNANGRDAGVYTCVIESELDQKTASARLTVMDYPDPPSKLELSDPYERTVRLTWLPGDSNFSPITEYLVQYDDDDWLPGKWKNLSTYPGSLTSVVLHLSPFTYYEFRVIAINEIGPSRPSRPSMRFQTSGAPPDVIPKNVKGVGTWTNNMEISWEPLTYREWNGPHLKYLVWWRRRDSREEWKNGTTKWLKYYIYDADTFTPYELKVQAVNDFGLGPESPVVIGYSGEDRPVSAPQNLRLSDIRSTRVTLHWDPVAQSSIMGQLKEYKVYFWRDSSQLRRLRVNRAMRSQVFADAGPEPSGVLAELVPYSNYKMYIVVANSRYEGPASNSVHFSTPEGVPSAPTSFRIQQRHLDSIYVDWELPAEPNGIISGYSLKYQTVNATKGEEQRVEEFLANVTSFSLRRYDRYTRYRFSVAARTRMGLGEWHTEESPHYTTEIYAQDQVDISTKGWFIGIMCAVALIVLMLLVVCFIKRSRGGKYPVREKKDISLEPTDDIDQEGSFDYRSLERITRVTTLPYPRWEDERSPPSKEDLTSRRSESDDSLVDYGDGGDVPYSEDGSFIGQYTAQRRDVRDLDFGGGLEHHSPANAIYSLA